MAPSTSRPLVIIVALTAAIVFQCCSQGSEYIRSNRQDAQRLNSMLGCRFEELWNRETINLSSRRARGIGFPSQVGEAGEEAPGGFPLNVQATFMDSVLVDEGIREFARLASMDTNSLNAYRESYRKRHMLGENVLVYVKVQTSIPEEYLSTDRWTFFVEDQDNSQVEPVRIVRHALQRHSPRGYTRYVPGREEWSSTTWILELYFPLKRLSPRKQPHDRRNEVRLVVVDNNNLRVRAEGTLHLMFNQ